MFTQGRPVPVMYSCADEASGLAAASAPRRSARTSTPDARHVHLHGDGDRQRRQRVRAHPQLHGHHGHERQRARRGTVAATLGLTLGTPATFGAFTPGVGKTYTAGTTANVISSAGDATLSVADPSANATGHLVNGTFSLAQPLQGLGTIKTWSAPAAGESGPDHVQADDRRN